jgi:hypothetical protein
MFASEVNVHKAKEMLREGRMYVSTLIPTQKVKTHESVASKTDAILKAVDKVSLTYSDVKNTKTKRR